MPSEYLHIAYLPASAAWLRPVLAAVQAGSHPRLKAAGATWESTALPELGLAITTKLEMLPQVAARLEELLALLETDVRSDPRLDHALVNQAALIPADLTLPYRLLAAVDAFLYEARSTYEISGKLLKTLYLHVLGQRVTEKQLRNLLKQAGVQDGWIEDLADHRKLFFHETAPWLALRVDSREPWCAELLILPRNVHRLAESKEVIPLSRLVAIYRGLSRALGLIRDRLVADIRALDEGERRRRPA